MARLLTIATAILASAASALAIGVCPATLDFTQDTSFTEYFGDQQNTSYYALSLATPTDESYGNGNTTGCTTNPAYVTRFTDSGADSCSWYATIRNSATPIETGCMYDFTNTIGDTLSFNMSCDEYSLGYDDPIYVTETAGKKHYAFTGYGRDMCQPTTSTTATDGPTETWTDGPTQTWTDGPTQTYTDGPTHTYTDGPTQTYTDGPTQTYTDGPTQTYSVSYVSNTYDATYVQSSIWDFLNVTAFAPYGTLNVECNTNRGANGNFSCIGTFSNFTQANASIYGANHGYIRYIYSGWWTIPVVYTNATFVMQEYYSYNLVYYIRNYLNIAQNDDSQGTITSVCNTSVASNQNTTCVASFSNYTQAVISVDAANNGKISNVYSAYIGTGTTTIAPMPTPTGMHSDTSSAMGILIGAMAGLVIFLALLSILYILLGRRRPTQSGDYEHLSEMNRANSNLKRV